jgi:hypothetical protein
MDELLHFLDGLIQSLAPGMAGLAAVSAPVVTAIVGLIKRARPITNGNVTQAITFGVSLVVVVIEAAAVGTFGNGVDVKEIGGLLIVTAIVFLGAIGTHEVITDRSVATNAPLKVETP